MGIFTETTGEILRSTKEQIRNLAPFQQRARIVDIACLPAYNHPWAQAIAYERNKKKIILETQRYIPQEPVNEGPVSHDLSKAAIKDIDLGSVSPSEEVAIHRTEVEQTQDAMAEDAKRLIASIHEVE